MDRNNEINFIEFQTTDIPKMKQFYGESFGWEFTDFGTEYCDIKNAGIAGWFGKMKEIETHCMAILYHDNLKEAQKIIEKNGGTVVVPIFSFPGGSRFEFLDPSGNRLAVWKKG